MGKIHFRAKTSGGDFSLPPEGTYDFEVEDVKVLDDTDDDGHTRLYLQLKVADGDHEGAEVRDYHTLSPERGWALRVILENTKTPFEMEEAEGDEVADFAFDPDDLPGRYFRADLTHYHNKKTKKTYPNFGNVQVSPLQEAAEASGDTAPPAEEAPKGGSARRGRARPSS